MLQRIKIVVLILGLLFTVGLFIGYSTAQAAPPSKVCFQNNKMNKHCTPWVFCTQYECWWTWVWVGPRYVPHP